SKVPMDRKDLPFSMKQAIITGIEQKPGGFDHMIGGVDEMMKVLLLLANGFEENMGKYLALANSEDIIITKNGKQVARLTGVHNTAMLTDSLIGIIPDSSVNLTTLREERLERYENNKGSN
ncbi:MAG TPA: hypothetical protein VHR47_10700, partial [Bacillota bacterium]|nr:hypothetical protein [Bacillota bacterium]